MKNQTFLYWMLSTAAVFLCVCCADTIDDEGPSANCVGSGEAECDIVDSSSETSDRETGTGDSSSSSANDTLETDDTESNIPTDTTIDSEHATESEISDSESENDFDVDTGAPSMALMIDLQSDETLNVSSMMIFLHSHPTLDAATTIFSSQIWSGAGIIPSEIIVPQPDLSDGSYYMTVVAIVDDETVSFPRENMDFSYTTTIQIPFGAAEFGGPDYAVTLLPYQI